MADLRDLDRRLDIAIIGTRGVPPRYGGFETFAAELGRRLVERGHGVTVYCRSSLYPEADTEWCGVRRVDLPAIRHKYLETVSHSFLSAIHAAGASYDAAILCNAANAFVLPILRAFRVPVAINVDGVERKRKKWNVLGRMVYQIGESWSAAMSDRLIADAEVIAEYYRTTFSASSRVIAYGSEIGWGEESDVLERLGLSSRRYVLYVSRFEPENNPMGVVESYGRVRTDVPLVMVGDAPYSRNLIDDVRRKADRRVLFPGALYGAGYAALQSNALVYVQATEVGGTHPAMIEGMASGGAVVANDTPENREVGGDTVRYFCLGEAETLSRLLQESVDQPESLDSWRRIAKKRAAEVYSWSAVTDQYEALLRDLAV